VVRLRDKALSNLFATTQNHYPIAHLKNVDQIMRNENHSDIILFQLQNFSFADAFFNGGTGDEAKYGFLMIHGANRELSGFVRAAGSILPRSGFVMLSAGKSAFSANQKGRSFTLP
jgi:hypothetical protein